MYYLTPSPFEALEEALPGAFSSPKIQQRLLRILYDEHSRVIQWKAHLEKIEKYSSEHLAIRTKSWKEANELLLEGIQKAANAISTEDEESLAQARVILKHGHDLLRK